MKILSKQLSNKAAYIIAEIENSLQYPVKFLPVAAHPPKKDSVFGSVDPYADTGYYRIWLREDLPQEAFETNVLHELFHIVQIESGYPSICNKDTADFHSPDRPFIQEVGSHIASLVLDIDVHNRLEKLGYSNDYFSQNNLDGALKNSGFIYNRLDDPLNFANLALALSNVSYALSAEDSKVLFKAYSAYPAVINTALQINTQLLKLNLATPPYVALGLSIVVDRLKIWSYYYVANSFIKIRTHKEFESLLNDLQPQHS